MTLSLTFHLTSGMNVFVVVVLWSIALAAAEEQGGPRVMALSSMAKRLTSDTRHEAVSDTTSATRQEESSRNLSLSKAQVHPWPVPKGTWFRGGRLQRPEDLHRPRPSRKVPLAGDQSNDIEKGRQESEAEDFPSAADKSLLNSSGKGILQGPAEWDLDSTPASEEANYSLSATEETKEEHDRRQGEGGPTEEILVDENAVQEPVVLPVTEGKNRGGHDYGLPKELMPIHPGGGSKFEDLEREKLERAKMAQTKLEDDDTENGNSYDAEGLYSSASLPSVSTHLLEIIVCVRIAAYISHSLFLPVNLDSVIFHISAM
ncbi:uncharacterized protein LOC134773295 [Penaeus indicus]|uniref:uncharacterized protein LOC134773295 n=1 Tax=Penaeus indicus TaxID=29960 RepID=UPI00300C615F